MPSPVTLPAAPVPVTPVPAAPVPAAVVPVAPVPVAPVSAALASAALASGAAGWSAASRCSGMLVGDVTSATVPWAKVNPVIAPQVLRLTSAVACDQDGLLLLTVRVGPLLPWAHSPCGRDLRICCTCGSPGLPAFWNSTLAFCAATWLAPGIHCLYTSATRAACPSRLVTGLAHRLGNPACEMMAADPVYLAQFSGLDSRPG